MGARTLYVGLDSVEPVLMHRWMRDGHLPTLARLCTDGATQPIRNYRGFGNGVYWPSLNACADPAEHGRFYIRQLVPGTYRVRPFDMQRDFRATPFWKGLDRRGARVATIDMVRTPLAQLDHGIEVANWLAHDPDGEIASTPPGLAGELRHRFGPDPLGAGCDQFIKRTGDHAALLTACKARIATKTTWCVEQLTRQQWDLFAVVFSEAHDVGHVSWHLHDPEHLAHDPALRQTLGDPLLAVYRDLDQALQTLIDASGRDTRVVVVTGPGMEDNRCGNHLLPAILRRIESGPPSAQTAPRRPSRLRRGYDVLAPTFIKRELRRLRCTLQGTEEERERAASRFFDVPHNDNAGAIRVNLRGREPRGRVYPGADFERLIDRLCEELTAIRDATSGLPIVDEIVRTTPFPRDSRVGALPDLLVIWNRRAEFMAVESPRIGIVEGRANRTRTGDHSDRGDVVIWPSPTGGTTTDGGMLDPAGAGRALRELTCQ